MEHSGNAARKCRLCVLTWCLHVCLWTIFNLRKQLHCFSLFLYFTGHSLLMAVMENATWPHPSYLPHYLLRGDPFASRLSREADVVAALYICIIGESFVKKNHHVCINVWFTIDYHSALCPTSIGRENRLKFALTNFNKRKKMQHTVWFSCPVQQNVVQKVRVYFGWLRWRCTMVP